MRELDEVLNRAVSAGAQVLGEAGPDAETAAAVRGAVRSRRRTRHAVQAVAALPVVAALALGGWAVAGQLSGHAPVATQTPAPTQPAPAPSALATPLPSETGLPERLAPPDGILDRAGAGWVLAAYSTPPGDDGVTPPHGTAILLSSPDGSVYELRRLSSVDGAPAGSWLLWELVDWDAKAGTALLSRMVAQPDQDVAQGLTGSSATLVRLDLRTGTLTPVPDSDGLDGWTDLGRVSDGGHAWLSYDANGAVVTVLADAGGRRTYPVTGEFDAASLSPDGTRVLVGGHVLDLATGATRAVPGLAAGNGCAALSWWTTTSVLASCTATTPEPGAWLQSLPRLVEVSVDGTGTGDGTSVLRAATKEDALFPVTTGSGVWLGERRALVLGAPSTGGAPPDTCDGDGVLLSVAGPGATFTPLPAADTRGLASFDPRSSGSLVAYASTPGGCGDAAPAPMLTVVDVDAATARVAIPLPTGVDPAALGTWRGLSGFALWR